MNDEYNENFRTCLIREDQGSNQKLFNTGFNTQTENDCEDLSYNSSQSEGVVYAICDGEYDGNLESERTSVSRGIILSLLRGENGSSNNFVRNSQTREESAFHIYRSTARHISLYPNKARWWQKGQVRYGYKILSMNEENLSKAFKPHFEPVEDKVCPICLDDLLTDLISLNGCLHFYHKNCFVDYALKSKKNKIVCPLCNCTSFAGRGPSPPGAMSWNVKKEMTLLSNGTFITTIEIRYKMKSGTQSRRHPKPGRPYKGVFKKAFLPITTDYLMILKLLILAFLDGQTFRIEDSAGEDFGTTVWNGIEHKTSIDGGSKGGGFPDNNYKSRVMENIMAKGITIPTMY